MLAKLGVSALILAVIGAVTLTIAAHSPHPAIVALIGAFVAFVAVLAAMLALFGDDYHPQEF